jgi:hypothetical protein
MRLVPGWDWHIARTVMMKLMKTRDFLCLFILGLAVVGASAAQDSKPAGGAAQETRQYSGMYSFLKEGEFVQITVEDNGQVTGFISRYGDGVNDKETFLDQFFKSGKIEGNKLTFSTKIVHGVSYDFAGSVERGDGKTPADEGYYVLKGTLTENETDANKKVTSKPQDVALKMIPGK